MGKILLKLILLQSKMKTCLCKFCRRSSVDPCLGQSGGLSANLSIFEIQGCRVHLIYQCDQPALCLLHEMLLHSGNPSFRWTPSCLSIFSSSSTLTLSSRPSHISKANDDRLNLARTGPSSVDTKRSYHHHHHHFLQYHDHYHQDHDN